VRPRTKKAKAAPKRPAGRGRPGSSARAGSSRPAPGRSTRPAPATSRPHPAAKPPAARATGGRPAANVRPLHDRVLIRRIEEADQKVGGIIIPDTAKEKPLQAEVIAVGSGRMLDSGRKLALILKPGDKVLIGKWSGTEVKIDGEELLILKEDEVLGVLS